MVADSRAVCKSLVFKVYSNGFRKKLLSQNPFLANIFIGFSRNYIRCISSISGGQPVLHPYFVTGFSDGDSYFSISLSRSTKIKTGLVVNLQFGISLHKKDRQLLELIQALCPSFEPLLPLLLSEYYIYYY